MGVMQPPKGDMKNLPGFEGQHGFNWGKRSKHMKALTYPLLRTAKRGV